LYGWLRGEKEQQQVIYLGGVCGAINDNFVITIDWEWADDPRDGSRGTHLELYFLL